MTLPPNRIGAARGPGGSTLDDIVDALNALRLSVDGNGVLLQSVLDTLGPMAVDLGKLSGSGSPPLGWLGLPSYLLGAFGVSNSDVPPLLNSSAEVRDLMRAVSLVLGNTGSPPTINPATSLYALTSALRDALTSPAGDNAYNRLGSIRDNSLALLQALGSLPSSPANQTVKQLLQALVDCCEQTPAPTNPLNPEPASACPSFGQKVRVKAFVPADSPLDLGGLTATYLLDFGDLTELSNPQAVAEYDTGQPPVASPVYVSEFGDVEFCLSWDLTDNEIPEQHYLLLASQVTWYGGERDANVITPFPTPVGSVTFAVNTSVRFGFLIDLAPGSALPNLNYWLSFSGPG